MRDQAGNARHQPHRTTDLIGVRVPKADAGRWREVAERHHVTVQELVRLATDRMCDIDEQEQADKARAGDRA